ncbi:MAG: hypothetical protein H8K07_20370 [Nitrospira sp.]|nr:hypothetical protein [Nitrospira sp.]
MRDLFDENDGEEVNPGRRIECEYDYVDENGVLVFQVVRFEPKDFRQRRPDGKGGWIWNVNGVQRTPYRLTDIKASPDKTINFHEGEKAVEAAIKAGLPGIHTTTAGGASNWHLTDLSICRGRKIVIFPDNDASGEKYATGLAAHLVKIAATVKIVRLPDVPTHGDAVEWIDLGGTPSEFQALCDVAPLFTCVNQVTPVKPNLRQRNRTDAGNAARFADQHRTRIRWCQTWKKWLVYDGKCWEVDPGELAMRLAKHTARSILEEALAIEDEDRRRKLVWWAMRSESAGRLQAMLEMAKSEHGIPVEPCDLDQDPWLLNVANGEIDLRSGELLPHNPAHMITKHVPIKYDTHAKCPTWRAFLLQIMNSDEQLMDFLQRAVGYSLTGSVREQVLFLLHGDGANGKSTLMRILLALLGDYSLQTMSETLLMSSRTGGVRNDLARLAGARLVAALESDAGRKLAVGVIKQLTGGDVMVARFLFAEYFEIHPTWKIWFSTNHRPTVNDDGDALWRRLRLIPFAVRIPDDKQDKELLSKLMAELPGILAWAVQGCLAWQREGLGCPEVVRVATTEYRETENVFDDFLSECCVIGPEEEVLYATLRTAYMEWVEVRGDKPISGKSFATELQAHKFTPKKIRNARHYRGLRLRSMADEVGEAVHRTHSGVVDVDLDD